MSDRIESAGVSCVGGEPGVPMASTFPADAIAVIYRPARSAMTSGTANSRNWKLRFERHSPPFVEPLMGWTGGDDTLAQVEMTFPSAQAAVAYAHRQGLEFVLQEPADRQVSTLKVDERGRGTARFSEREFVVEGAFQATAAESLVDDGHGRANGTTGYGRPSEVLRDPKLSVEQKRNLLRQWALDAYRTEVATMDGMPPSASQLDEAIDALIDLDGGTASMSKLSTMRSAKAGDRAQAA
jgi:ETC complex I subunit conserved region